MGLRCLPAASIGWWALFFSGIPIPIDWIVGIQAVGLFIWLVGPNHIHKNIQLLESKLATTWQHLVSLQRFFFVFHTQSRPKKTPSYPQTSWTSGSTLGITKPTPSPQAPSTLQGEPPQTSGVHVFPTFFYPSSPSTKENDRAYVIFLNY